MNALKFEDHLQLHLGYTTLFTSQNSVVNLAAINSLAALPAHPAARKGHAKTVCPCHCQMQEASEASKSSTITQTLETPTSTLSELGQRLNWLL